MGTYNRILGLHETGVFRDLENIEYNIKQAFWDDFYEKEIRPLLAKDEIPLSGESTKNIFEEVEILKKGIKVLAKKFRLRCVWNGSIDFKIAPYSIKGDVDYKKKVFYLTCPYLPDAVAYTAKTSLDWMEKYMDCNLYDVYTEIFNLRKTYSVEYKEAQMAQSCITALCKAFCRDKDYIFKHYSIMSLIELTGEDGLWYRIRVMYKPLVNCTETLKELLQNPHVTGNGDFADITCTVSKKNMDISKYFLKV